jgi:hypothetical protein
MVVIVLACDRIGPEHGSSILLSNIGMHLQDYTFVIIIIMIGKTALFEPWPFSEDPVRFVHSQLCVVNRPSCFHFVGCCNDNFFLQNKVVSLASNPQPGGLGLCIYVRQ